METSACPLCAEQLEGPATPEKRHGEVIGFDCPNCGNYALSKMVVGMAERKLSERERAILSYAIRKMQRSQEQPLIRREQMQQILEAVTLPSPFEQLDNLILFLGEALPVPGDATPQLEAPHCRAVIGAQHKAGAGFVLREAYDNGMVSGLRPQGSGADYIIFNAHLTFKGWQRFHELQKGATTSKRAFMAMKFNDPRLDRIVDEFIKRAVDQTGFTLARVTEEPKAGLIDDRIRVDIRTSRFLIADLTHGNEGAYWEAGYAEGLGKPVIYTCAKEAMDKLHFDTNHHLTVSWSEETIKDDMERLKATIRATLPDEAKLMDDEDNGGTSDAGTG